MHNAASIELAHNKYKLMLLWYLQHMRGFLDNYF